MSNNEKLRKRPSMWLMKRAHWQVPATMLLCFLGAMILATGHHGFYLGMDGKSASGSRQTWVIRGGTILAYLVKVLLIVATGVAYIQWLWRCVRNQNMKLKDLDSTFSVLENIWALNNHKVWIRNPMLFLLAAITWGFPLVAIIPPSAISVRPAQILSNTNVTLYYTPFWHRGWFVGLPNAQNSTLWNYVGTGPSALSLAVLSIFERTVVNAELPKQNLTFSDSFLGPAIRCEDAGLAISQSIARQTTEAAEKTNVTKTYSSRVPMKLPNDTDIVLVETATLVYTDDQIGSPYLDLVSPDIASVYITIAPPYLGLTGNASDVYTMRCGLYNASWVVDFDVKSGGSQIIRPRSITLLDQVSGMSPMEDPTDDEFEKFGYGAALDLFSDAANGQMFQFGSLDAADQNAQSQNTTSYSGAFLTKDFEFLSAFQEWGVMNVMRYLGVTLEFMGYENSTRENDVIKPLLISRLESLFHNITLSVRYGYGVSSDFGAVNSGSYEFAHSVQPAAVLSTMQNVFNYSQQELLVTYSFGVLLCLATVMVGLYAIAESGKSYQASFTTIARVTHKQEELDRTIQTEFDYSGAEPTPHTIQTACIVIGEPYMMTGQLAMTYNHNKLSPESSFDYPPHSICTGQQNNTERDDDLKQGFHRVS